MATRIDVTLDDLHQLQQRIDRQQLAGEDWALVNALVSMLIARTVARQARLKAKAAQQSVQDNAEESQAGGAGPAIDDEHEPHAEDTTSPSEPDEPAPEGAAEAPKKGHGRNGATAFVHATTYVHALAAGIIGAICALCGVGRVFRYRVKTIVRVRGQSIFAAEHHQFEQGRCRLCRAIFTAEGRELVLQGIGTSYITYDASACAMLIVLHYFAGAPFKRLEALHRGWGVPMPDANQWRIVDECDDRLAPLYRAIEKHAIQNATRLSFDDTGSMIIDTRRQIQQEIHALTLVGESTKSVRTGINATGFYIETKEATVILFFTGRHHAGEMVDRLLAHRRASDNKKLVTVTDAASKNFSLEHADKLEQAVCHAHCYLKFRAVKNQFPAEYAVAGEVYAKVFDNDDKAKARGLDPHERMLFHREHSRPQMLRLWQLCMDKTDSNLVEPSSTLWEPIHFVIHQWPLLTKFYEVPGVPLDSNLVEQALIIPVRYLAGSFAYKTQNGADVGDRHMSLIATANASGIEPVAYLTECLQNHEDLAKRPDHYLPWIYRDRLQVLDTGPQAQTLPLSGPSPPPSQEIQHPLRPGTRRAHAHPPGAP